MSAPSSKLAALIMWTPAIIFVCALSGAAIAAGSVLRAVRGLMNRTGDPLH